MVVQLTNLTSKSANLNKKFRIIETQYEYFNTHSKHFVRSSNPFLFLFVLIWHYNTTDFKKKIKGTWSEHSFNGDYLLIYLSLSAQVAVGTFFMKSPVALGHTSIVLALLNSTEKMRWLYVYIVYLMRKISKAKFQ